MGNTLEPGPYVASVTVTNFFGVSSTASTAFERAALPAPLVRIEAPSSLYLASSARPLNLVGLVASTECMDTSMFSIHWESSNATGLSTINRETISSWQGHVQPRVLNIPAYGLRGGGEYMFKITAVALNQPGSVPGLAVVRVVVGSSSLVASIKGGKARQFSDMGSKSLSMDGSGSYDPGCGEGCKTGLQYQWTCDMRPTKHTPRAESENNTCVDISGHVLPLPATPAFCLGSGGVPGTSTDADGHPTSNCSATNLLKRLFTYTYHLQLTSTSAATPQQ
jgi:hypothetical protein